jgi:hypothetical protein
MPALHLLLAGLRSKVVLASGEVLLKPWTGLRRQGFLQKRASRERRFGRLVKCATVDLASTTSIYKFPPAPLETTYYLGMLLRYLASEFD